VIVFALPDGGIDNVVTALASKGTTIITPVSHAPRGWSADIADPDGHLDVPVGGPVRSPK
jgi:glyoxylase I family protein